MSNLADVIWNGAPKSILDPFASQKGTGAKTGYGY
jgi:methane/ammonia monooxygenase subunit C